MDGTLKKKYETTTVLYSVVDRLNKCWMAASAYIGSPLR